MAKSYINSLLAQNEKIILVSRQHWFILFSSILLEIILIIAITIIAAVCGVFLAPLIGISSGIITIVGAIIALIPLVSMLFDIFKWRNHQYMITNRRVIQISGIFNKSITDSSLEKVNDVHMEQSFFGRIFDYGDVEILTASELGVNQFKRIAKPVSFKTAMLNAKEQLEHGDVEMSTENIPDVIARLDQLRSQGILSEDEFQKKKSELLSKL
ncbi:MAG: PH domain-containing protein [Chloroflexi bacterium]|nr:PH domain-containing protein [Chloroflexota bacterium]